MKNEKKKAADRKLKAPPKTNVEATLETMAGQQQNSNDELLKRVKKDHEGDADITDLVNRFETSLTMCSKPQRYYRDDFEKISKTSHDKDDQDEANS